VSGGWIGSLDWGACSECGHDNGDGCEFNDRPIELEQDGDGVICVDFTLRARAAAPEPGE
jgi:hypothetical protein